MNNLNVVGTVAFDNRLLNVYQSLENPIFRATDIANMIDYSEGNSWKMLQMCEEDEKFNLPMVTGGQTRQVAFVTETGLYNILSQSRTPAARKWQEEWRIGDRLVNMRKSNGMSIVDQFNAWDSLREDDDV